MSLIGKSLGNFEITSQLGKGGMGEVYRAKDQKLGRDVALKVLPDELARDADNIARFRRDLTDHAYAWKIERDVQEGIRNGVNATPKFYVNGERVDGKVPLENLADIVDRVVSAASARG